jgi:hypothetical protein
VFEEVEVIMLSCGFLFMFPYIELSSRKICKVVVFTAKYVMYNSLLDVSINS